MRSADEIRAELKTVYARSSTIAEEIGEPGTPAWDAMDCEKRQELMDEGEQLDGWAAALSWVLWWDT